MADMTDVDVPGEEAEAPTYSAREQKLLDAYSLSTASGIGNENKLARRLKRRGIDVETADLKDWSTADDSDYNKIAGMLNRTKGDWAMPSVARKKWQSFKEDMAHKAAVDRFDKDVQPTYDRISQQLQDMLDSPNYSAEEWANVRSELTSQARSQEANRLRRVGAALGLRGVDPGSIAGAALTNSVAEETDRALTEALRRFGLDAMQQERESQAQELGLSFGLTTAMNRARTDLDDKSYDRSYQINDDISAIMEAISARNDTLNAQQGASRQNFLSTVATGGAGAAGEIFG